MGYALAAEAVRRGARVLLVSGPTALTPPEGLVAFERIENAEQLLDKTRQLLPQADVLLMAAAVADYRPRTRSASKLKRQAGGMQMELEPTPDLLATLAPLKGERFFVGFALETDDLQQEAQRKLRDKGCDWIIANRVSPDTGPDVDTNQVTIFGTQGVIIETSVLPKSAIASSILDALEKELQDRPVAARP
jgi:phosphopantothenoylcysteine decarboxylase/phosphopantothenate--cysteine ligase